MNGGKGLTEIALLSSTFRSIVYKFFFNSLILYEACLKTCFCGTNNAVLFQLLYEQNWEEKEK